MGIIRWVGDYETLDERVLADARLLMEAEDIKAQRETQQREQRSRKR